MELSWRWRPGQKIPETSNFTAFLPLQKPASPKVERRKLFESREFSYGLAQVCRMCGHNNWDGLLIHFCALKPWGRVLRSTLRGRRATNLPFLTKKVQCGDYRGLWPFALRSYLLPLQNGQERRRNRSRYLRHDDQWWDNFREVHAWHVSHLLHSFRLRLLGQHKGNRS